MVKLFASFVFLILVVNSSAASRSEYIAHALAAMEVLQQWYNPSTGLWDSTGWWNSANCLTVLADLVAVDPSVRDVAGYVFATTLVQAQKRMFDMTNVMTKRRVLLHPGNRTVDVTSTQLNGFLNKFYDDEGWWALAWIKVYDVTGEQQYLDVATSIFEDMKKGWDTPCGGGIWWDKDKTYVNAIANELFLSVAAHLSNRKDNKQYYLYWALKEWDWFRKSGMINSANNINDGLTLPSCKNNHLTVWSYNQGTVLGGLVELSRAVSDRGYIGTATTIAYAGIEALSSSEHILHKSCEPDCGGDASQFKGILMRNLASLYTATRSEILKEYIEDNAVSIWAYDRDVTGKLGLIWAGPSTQVANASTHSSALDALVAAIVVA